MPLEIACFNLSSAITALSSGVDRIEFCSGASVGGLTPLKSDFQSLLQHRKSLLGHSIPINIMIRPRGGDFLYTDAEFDLMKTFLTEFSNLGADGFVFGILTPQGEVDEQRCRELVILAAGKPCTFHRAFDQIDNKLLALEGLVRCGFASVLTAGGEDVVVGRSVLRELVVAAKGRIEIMPGGGVRSRNLKEVKMEVKADWWHSSAIVDGSEEADAEEVRRLKRLVDE
ncbi:MAG: hypothetical protein GOMPHAMPRED_000745 [Gomphillus americanus]|uniref:Copper homeostasis protein cutC homolog n=1 Tax=Gomphillus americanus TaxID=1940652 RepID=A0A8H3EZD6_9LECA|nr:MAG: hypothetical protein GOMPHAMPRED_000745 [Gomphillus americanus]